MTGLAFKPLHPTFGAEVIGADFTNPSVDLVDNLKKALAKVSHPGGRLSSQSTADRQVRSARVQVDRTQRRYPRGHVPRLW